MIICEKLLYILILFSFWELKSTKAGIVALKSFKGFSKLKSSHVEAIKYHV